jgi:uncharacterized protein (TIGR02271 family)
MQDKTNRRQSTGRTWTQQQLAQGAHVVDANGDKVGTLMHYDPTQGSLLVDKGWGWFSPQEAHIPVDAVNSANADTITLRYSKRELQDRDWTLPSGQSTTPAPTATTTPPTAGAHTKQPADTPPAMGARTKQPAGTRNEQDIRVPVHEEELVVGKRQQEKGRIHLHKDVVEEQQTVSTPVTHEEVYVEHVVVNDEIPADTDAFVERDIDVPIMGEEVITSKRAKTTEEVRLRKEAVTDQRQVSDTVRKERLNMQHDSPLVHDDAATDTNTRPQP